MQQHSAPKFDEQISLENLAFVAISGKIDKQTGALLRHAIGISATTTQKISTLESSGKRKFTAACKSVTRSHKVSTLPRWLLTPHLRVCAGLHKVSTYEPCDQSKVNTGGSCPKPCTRWRNPVEGLLRVQSVHV